jgi:hypothetical protein
MTIRKREPLYARRSMMPRPVCGKRRRARPACIEIAMRASG